LIVAVVCPSFFFCGSCFAIVQWRWYKLNGLFVMLLLVVVFSLMALLSQRSAVHWQACIYCCSPLHVVFYLKNWKRATYRKKLYCCVCLMELFLFNSWHAYANKKNFKNTKSKKKYKNLKKMIVAVVCRSFFFSCSCFAIVQWKWYLLNGLFMLLLVVVFSSVTQTMPLSQRSAVQWQACIWCCSPLQVVFYLKNILLCLFDGVVFCSTARFFLLSVEGTPCWTACTLCYYCLQGAFLFHENWKNNTKILYFVIPCSCFCWTARFCSCLIVSFVDSLVYYFATACRLCSS